MYILWSHFNANQMYSYDKPVVAANIFFTYSFLERVQSSLNHSLNGYFLTESVRDSELSLQFVTIEIFIITSQNVHVVCKETMQKP
jgi:hypothetical protein